MKVPKGKRPSFQFYPGDWLRDLALQSCSLAARGLWIQMLCLMHDGQPYGHLRVQGEDISEGTLKGLAGSAGKHTFEDVFEELETKQVFARTRQGTIYSKRMVRDEMLRQARAEGGYKGVENPRVRGYREPLKGSLEQPLKGPLKGLKDEPLKGTRREAKKDRMSEPFRVSPAVAPASALNNLSPTPSLGREGAREEEVKAEASQGKALTELVPPPPVGPVAEILPPPPLRSDVECNAKAEVLPKTPEIHPEMDLLPWMERAWREHQRTAGSRWRKPKYPGTFEKHERQVGPEVYRPLWLLHLDRHPRPDPITFLGQVRAAIGALGLTECGETIQERDLRELREGLGEKPKQPSDQRSERDELLKRLEPWVVITGTPPGESVAERELRELDEALGEE